MNYILVAMINTYRYTSLTKTSFEKLFNLNSLFDPTEYSISKIENCFEKDVRQ